MPLTPDPHPPRAASLHALVDPTRLPAAARTCPRARRRRASRCCMRPAHRASTSRAPPCPRAHPCPAHAYVPSSPGPATAARPPSAHTRLPSLAVHRATPEPCARAHCSPRVARHAATRSPGSAPPRTRAPPCSPAPLAHPPCRFPACTPYRVHPVPLAPAATCTAVPLAAAARPWRRSHVRRPAIAATPPIAPCAEPRRDARRPTHARYALAARAVAPIPHSAALATCPCRGIADVPRRH
ncbi:atherin-like [Panicum virgatum]|uniref:atherin-like n=1 Tax=Panicum virgatum TaxID=38727 RepID=UPI0019D53FA7|nr:atherin-like [Panicum virgatum]